MSEEDKEIRRHKRLAWIYFVLAIAYASVSFFLLWPFTRLGAGLILFPSAALATVGAFYQQEMAILKRTKKFFTEVPRTPEL